MQELEAVKPPTGKLSVKHKMMAVVLGAILKWIGDKLMSIDTYEQFNELGQESRDKLDALEEEYEDMLN